MNSRSCLLEASRSHALASADATGLPHAPGDSTYPHTRPVSSEPYSGLGATVVIWPPCAKSCRCRDPGRAFDASSFANPRSPADGQGELGPRTDVARELQADELHQERKSGVRLLVGVIDVEPVVLALHRDVRVRRPILPFVLAECTREKPLITSAQSNGLRCEPTVSVASPLWRARGNVDAVRYVVQELQQRARFQIEVGDAFRWEGGPEGIEGLLRDAILGESFALVYSSQRRRQSPCV